MGNPNFGMKTTFFLFYTHKKPFFRKKNAQNAFLGVWKVYHVGYQKTIEFNGKSKFLDENDFFPVLPP